MTKTSLLHSQFNLWFFNRVNKQGLPNHAFVCAGGFAANPEAANDVDVWFHAKHTDKIKAAFPEMLVRPSSDYPGGFVLGDVLWDSRVVQLIACLNDMTQQNLLDSFDISTHAIGFCVGCGVPMFGDHYTTTTEPMRLNKIINHPSKTLQRVKKLQDRYGLPLEAESMTRLMDALFFEIQAISIKETPNVKQTAQQDSGFTDGLADTEPIL